MPGQMPDQRELTTLVEILYDATGNVIMLPQNGEELPKNVWRLVQARAKCERKYDTWAEVIRVLSRDAVFRQEYIENFLVPETRFFRVPAHFDFVTNLFMNTKRKEPDKVWNIWDAACATGQESYSIAMLAASCGVQAIIRATDISEKFLAKAKAGVYGAGDITKTPLKYRQTVITYTEDYRVRDVIRAYVSFGEFNLKELMSEDVVNYGPLLARIKKNPGQIGDFDIIFMRNVMYYFGPRGAEAIREHIPHLLTPGGYFFVGESESIPLLDKHLQQHDNSIYINMRR